jgi:hypothetical protein
MGVLQTGSDQEVENHVIRASFGAARTPSHFHVNFGVLACKSSSHNISTLYSTYPSSTIGKIPWQTMTGEMEVVGVDTIESDDTEVSTHASQFCLRNSAEAS